MESNDDTTASPSEDAFCIPPADLSAASYHSDMRCKAAKRSSRWQGAPREHISAIPEDLCIEKTDESDNSSEPDVMSATSSPEEGNSSSKTSLTQGNSMFGDDTYAVRDCDVVGIRSALAPEPEHMLSESELHSDSRQAEIRAPPAFDEMLLKDLKATPLHVRLVQMATPVTDASQLLRSHSESQPESNAGTVAADVHMVLPKDDAPFRDNLSNKVSTALHFVCPQCDRRFRTPGRRL